MAEVGIPYTFLSPDGHRAVVGNGAAAQADPDWVGFLDPENGITGILDTPAHRTSTSELVEGDGGAAGNTYYGLRTGTVQGTYVPGADMPFVSLADHRLELATRALRADGFMRWTPSGDTIERQLRIRRSSGPTVSGRRPKTFQIVLLSTDAYVLSSSELSQVIVPGLAAGETGIPNPIRNPITSSLNVTGQTFVTNQGDAPTWPRFRIDGPIVNPQVLNYTAGLSFTILYTLNAGDWLDVLPATGQITVNGSGDRSGSLDFVNSSWWQLAGGISDVRLLASSYSAGAQLTVYWQHAWGK